MCLTYAQRSKNDFRYLVVRARVGFSYIVRVKVFTLGIILLKQRVFCRRQKGRPILFFLFKFLIKRSLYPEVNHGVSNLFFGVKQVRNTVNIISSRPAHFISIPSFQKAWLSVIIKFNWSTWLLILWERPVAPYSSFHSDLWHRVRLGPYICAHTKLDLCDQARKLRTWAGTKNTIYLTVICFHERVEK